MKSKYLTAAAVLSLATASIASAAAIGLGNLVVYRVGEGTAALSNASTAVFLDEYSPTGTLLQSIPLSTGTASPLTASGTATSEGFLNLSTDGKTVVAPGYLAATGVTGIAGTTALAVQRGVVSVGLNGNVSAVTSYGTSALNANNIRSAATVNGSSIYAAGPTGLFVTASGNTSTATVTSINTTNTRALNITAGQLYGSSNSGSLRLGTEGTGLPAGAAAFTQLTGFPVTGSPYAFFFADLSTTVAGVDTLYVADDGASTGLQKFSLVGGSWVAKGNIAVTGNGLRGLTGYTDTTTGNVILYATTAGAIYSFTDTTGYNANLSGSLTSIATAGTNTAFRGIAVVPEPTSLGLIAVAGAGLLARRRRA